jgi:choline dehydrogenase-like flavoprotein
MSDGTTAPFDYDFVVVGSGFGGATAALRLVEKGYRVLVLEKGSELGPAQFPKTNWNLKRWLWLPLVGFRGLFRMTFFRHVTILSGVGVGGGSLVYACTHPVPKDSFYASPSWAHLADWKAELAPHYLEAKRMLGVATTPMLTPPDEILRDIAAERGRPEAFHPTDVAVWFPTRTSAAAVPSAPAASAAAAACWAAASAPRTRSTRITCGSRARRGSSCTPTPRSRRCDRCPAAATASRHCAAAGSGASAWPTPRARSCSPAACSARSTCCCA